MFHFGSVGGIIFQSEIAQAGRSVDFYKQARFALSHKNVPFYTTAFGTAILVGLALPHPLAYNQHFMLRFTAFTLRRMASGKETYEESVQELKTLFPDGDYPSLKELKATKAELMEQRDKLRAELKMFTVEKRNLDVVWKNVQAILDRGRSIMAKQRSETPWNHSRIRELEL